MKLNKIESQRRYYNALEGIKNAIDENKKINLSHFVHKYRISGHTPKSLVNIRVLRKEGGKYIWNAGKPNLNLVNKILDENNKIATEYKNKTTAITPKLEIKTTTTPKSEEKPRKVIKIESDEKLTDLQRKYKKTLIGLKEKLSKNTGLSLYALLKDYKVSKYFPSALYKCKIMEFKNGKYTWIEGEVTNKLVIYFTDYMTKLMVEKNKSRKDKNLNEIVSKSSDKTTQDKTTTERVIKIFGITIYKETIK